MKYSYRTISDFTQMDLNQLWLRDWFTEPVVILFPRAKTMTWEGRK